MKLKNKYIIILMTTGIIVILFNIILSEKEKFIINNEEFRIGKSEFKRVLVNNNNNNFNKKIEVLDYTFTTYNNKYHINFRVPYPKKTNDTLVFFGEPNDTTFIIKSFNIQTEFREVFYKSKNRSLKMSITKTEKNKFDFKIKGTLYSNLKKDSLSIRGDLTLTTS